MTPAPAAVTAVTSAADPRLDDFRALVDSDVRPDRRGVVIAEGVNVVQRLLRSEYRVRAVFGVPGKLEPLAADLAVAARREVPIYSADKWLLSDVAGFRVTRGVLASADRPAPRPASDLLATGRRFAVLESVNDFENIGAVFRNAAAFGLDGVLLDGRCSDPLYRRSVRVSMGHVLSMPFAVLPDPFPTALGKLRAAGSTLLALTPRASAVPLREIRPPQRWALLLGAEGPGLSDAALQQADEQVRIPMAPGVDSLNIATAAAVAFAWLTG